MHRVDIVLNESDTCRSQAGCDHLTLPIGPHESTLLTNRLHPPAEPLIDAPAHRHERGQRLHERASVARPHRHRQEENPRPDPFERATNRTRAPLWSSMPSLPFDSE